MSTVRRTLRSVRGGADTDQRFHNAVAELEALMQATAAEQASVGSNRLLAQMVGAPLLAATADSMGGGPASGPVRTSRPRPTEHAHNTVTVTPRGQADARQSLQEVLDHQRYMITSMSYGSANSPAAVRHPSQQGPSGGVSESSVLPKRPTSTPVPSRATTLIAAAHEGRCHSAGTALDTTYLFTGVETRREIKSATSDYFAEPVDAFLPPAPSESSSPGVRCQPDGLLSRPDTAASTISSSTRTPSLSQPAPDTGVAVEQRVAAARHREALADALAVSEARREERRRARASRCAEQEQPQTPQSSSCTANAAAVESSTSAPHAESVAASTSAVDGELVPDHIATSPASATRVAAAAPPPPTVEQVYHAEVQAIRAEAAAHREQRLAELRKARMLEEHAEQSRRRITAFAKDLAWDETGGRLAVTEAETEARSRCYGQRAMYTAELDEVVQHEQAARNVMVMQPEAAAFHALQRLELFNRWVEVAAGLRVDAEIDMDVICEQCHVEGAWAQASEWHGEGRERIIDAWASQLNHFAAAFGAEAATIIERELWLTVNAEADSRFVVEADERESFFTMRDGCSSSRALVKKHADAVRECARQWKEYFVSCRTEIIDLELSGRLLLHREAFDGIDKLTSDESFERTQIEVVALRRRKEAVTAAIREAQEFHAATAAAAVEAPVSASPLMSNGKSAVSRTGAAKTAPPPKKSPAAVGKAK